VFFKKGGAGTQVFVGKLETWFSGCFVLRQRQIRAGLCVMLSSHGVYCWFLELWCMAVKFKQKTMRSATGVVLY
jgi:hypothetical protein